MNAFKLIISKNKVKYLYSHNTFLDGMEALKQSGYSAIPVIKEDGTYAGTVCDKDFLFRYSAKHENIMKGNQVKDNQSRDSKFGRRMLITKRRRLRDSNDKLDKSNSVSDENSKINIQGEEIAYRKYAELSNINLEEIYIQDIINEGWNPAINISSDINDVLLISMKQNFVPVVDDMNMFLGIITRRDIIKFLSEQSEAFPQSAVAVRVDDAKKMEIAIHQLEKNVAPYEMFTKMYEAAMKEICIRVETINEMLKFKYNREPLHHIENRIKSPRSVMGKLAKKNLEATVENMQNNLYDIAGVRVICAYIYDVYEFARYLEEQPDLRLIKKKDYIANPKPNGYRSLHLILEVPINYIGAMKMIPVEIQFRTEPMDYWASLEHDLRYKPVFNSEGVDISAQLKECSNQLAKTEETMQNLAQMITGAKEDNIF